MAVRLHDLDDSKAGPAQKKVRLSLSPRALKRESALLDAEAFRPILTVTPEVFDATPSDATGLAGRRKSSRSRVYSQHSSGKGSCDSVMIQFLLSVACDVAAINADIAMQPALVRKEYQQEQHTMQV